MRDKMQVSGVEETRTRLPEILRAAHHEGAVTIVTKRGEPYAAVNVCPCTDDAPLVPRCALPGDVEAPVMARTIPAPNAQTRPREQFRLDHLRTCREQGGKMG